MVSLGAYPSRYWRLSDGTEDRPAHGRILYKGSEIYGGSWAAGCWGHWPCHRCLRLHANHCSDLPDPARYICHHRGGTGTGTGRYREDLDGYLHRRRYSSACPIVPSPCTGPTGYGEELTKDGASVTCFHLPVSLSYTRLGRYQDRIPRNREQEVEDPLQCGEGTLLYSPCMWPQSTDGEYSAGWQHGSWWWRRCERDDTCRAQLQGWG